MTDELNLGATGEYPEGRLGPDDEGELRMAIAADKQKGVVVVQFGKPVTWFAMEKSYALGLADSIKKRAEEL